MNNPKSDRKRAPQSHQAARPAAAGAPEPWLTPEGIPVKALYTAADLEALEQVDTQPGVAPFVRGPHATMYRGRPWTIRQYAGLSTAEESNRFFRQLLAGGAQGVSVAFDLATQRGYDSDHPRVVADVGKAGVAIDTVEDMGILFDSIPLDQISVSMTINAAVLPVFAAFLVAAEEQGVASNKLRGTIQNDILKEFLVRNTYIYPPHESLRIVADVLSFCQTRIPQFNSISVSGYHMHEAGADAAIELAYTLANGQEYLRVARRAGIGVDDCAPRMSFFFGLGMNFYFEIAKLRAARLLWSRIVEEFGPRDPRSQRLRMHCQTSGCSLTQQDPYNNVVRTTIEAMAGVFGGTQSLHTNSFDEAIALPSEESARIARNTQLILQEETGIPNVVDPWGGSYFMEQLTHSLAEKATGLIKEINSLGGMARAIESGIPKRRIEQAAAARQARIDRQDDVIVGVNKYGVTHQTFVDAVNVDNFAVRDQQIQRLQRIRETRDGRQVETALAQIERAARDPNSRSSLLELSINAMRVRATVGEVSAALERAWGRHAHQPRPAAGVYGTVRRGDKDWAAVAEGVHQFRQVVGRAPSLLVCKLGQDGHDRGARLIAGAFEDVGWHVELAPLFATPEEIGQLALEGAVDVIGVSTQAAGHNTTVPVLIEYLEERGRADLPIVVGGVIPLRDRERLLAVGVSAIYGPGTPLHVAAAEVLSLASAGSTPESAPARYDDGLT